MRKLCVELTDLIEALENESEGINYYLNLLNGEVIKVPEDYCADETISQIDYNEPEKFFKILPIAAEDQLRLREKFLAYVDDENIRDKLEIALTHRGPLRKFAEILNSSEVLLKKWKEFEAQNLKTYIGKWGNSVLVDIEII